MPTDKEIKQLVLNVLTEEQYASIAKKEDELYLTPDNSDEIKKLIPTDVAIKDNKLGLEHDSTWLTNQKAINLGSNMKYDTETNTLDIDEGELKAQIQEATINKQNKLKEPTDGSIKLYNNTDQEGNPYTDIISKVKIASPTSSAEFHIEAKTYEVGEYLSAKFNSNYGVVINRTNRYSSCYTFTDSSGIVGLISVVPDKSYPTNYGIVEMVIIKGGTVATAHDETVWVNYLTIMNAE